MLYIMMITSQCTAASIVLLSLSAGMMATQMNSKVETGELDKFSIVQVEKLIVNTVQSRKYASSTSIITIHVLSTQCV